jgi:hypothetical protein
MVNGVDSVQALLARGVPRLLEHLAHLLELGLIAPALDAPQPLQPVSAPVSNPAPLLAPEPPESRPAPAPAAEPVAEEQEEPDPRIDAQCPAVLERLRVHFGAYTVEVAKHMLMARTVAEFNAAIEQIESQLIPHLGRNRAQREAAMMRLPEN